MYFSNFIYQKKFAQLRSDPKKVYEAKMQRTLHKMKHKFAGQEYQKLYSTGLNAGRFYGTRKIDKVHDSGTINDLPIRPIVSNIGTASYHLSKYLAHLLSP